VDLNPALGYEFAIALGECPSLPDSLGDVDDRAALIDAIDRPFAVEKIEPGDEGTKVLRDVVRNIGTNVGALARTSAAYMPGVADPLDRVIIALRLWAGCIWAAKTVAEGTLSGANTPTMRADAFAQIDDYARNDPVFAAGVEAAPAFKRRRGETYSFDGVPDDSPVRRHPR
jgi:hypothetical protein